MKIPLGQKKKTQLVVRDLISGETRVVQKYPFMLGSSNRSDWKLGQSGTPWTIASATISNDGENLIISPESTPSENSGVHHLLLDGEVLSGASIIASEKTQALKISGYLFAIKLTQETDCWPEHSSSWMVYNGKSNSVIGAGTLDQVGGLIANSGQPFEECAITLEGLDAAFWVTALPEIVGVPVYEEEEPAVQILPVQEKQELQHVENVSTTQGENHCPICWQQFPGKHILHIAAHPSLRGDELLGANEMRRFVPNQFDDEGNALDDFGLIAPDMACPHCHHRLPQGFLESPQNILSVVGAPSSGKSYYLAILIQQLKRSLFENFDLTFGDQDPEYNIELNASINRLFSASSPEQGQIIKTQLTGGVYRRVKRDGQDVDLPKPYIFNCSANEIEGKEKCIVFYDNAGEHFLPQNSTSEDFHILHVARAKAIFFIFDPISNIEFKRRLKGRVEDPQLAKEDYEPDNQDVILAQMNVKIKRALGLPFNEKLNFPLSVIVGKSDVWNSIMPNWEKIENPVHAGRLDLSVVGTNSELTRSFLASLTPSVVANAEKLSSNVCFFPLSTFGHRPKTFPDPDTGEERIAPDPHRIAPEMIDIPSVWALSQIAPALVPTC